MNSIKPFWLRTKIPSGQNYVQIKKSLQKASLHTVCEEASCPNISECWGVGTATIMIMGDICSRACRFCNVTSGRPSFLDPDEPKNVAKSIRDWNLRYVVVTSVCRDDLEDEGSGHFAKTICEIKRLCPDTMVESLIPDFSANQSFIKKIVDARPHIISHNIETVRWLSDKVRDHRANYDQSLCVLRTIKDLDSRIFTKSSLMLGLGETHDEVLQTGHDLKNCGVSILTLGQYLRPTLSHLPVKEFVHPSKFFDYKTDLKKMGFLHIASGPLVRSSFRASEIVNIIKNQ